MKILIVEDDPKVLERIFLALTLENVDLKKECEARGVNYPLLAKEDIEIARNRDTALELANRENFDLVLLDLYLPEAEDQALPAENVLYGNDVLKAVRDRTPPPEVIVLSAYARDDRAGLQLFEEAVRIGKEALLPEDILWKEDYQDSDLLQRKLVSYFVDLSTSDEERLNDENIFVPPLEIPSATRLLLRKLKRVAWSSERDRPLPDVVLVGERGAGKATLARALHLLRPEAAKAEGRRLGFDHVEMLPVYRGKGDPMRTLAGTSGDDGWGLGALPRTTFYTRNGDWVRLPGQKVHEKDRFYTFDGVPSARLYPRSTDCAKFDASGTLYLEDVFSENIEYNEEIEAFLSPDLDQRYVTTRGKLPLRLHVGASIILGFTQSDLAKLYTQKVGCTTIEVPPVRERSSEEKKWLLQRFFDRRHGRKRNASEDSIAAVRLESTMERIIGEYLEFYGNFDDFQAIANQVLPEERSISWRHLNQIWQRDRARRSSSPAR